VETKPAAPSQLLAQIVDGVIVITWQDVSDNEQGFVLERRIANGVWEQLANLSMNVTEFQNRSYEADTVYEYRLSAFNEAGSSEFLNYLAAQTPAEEVNQSCDEVQYVAGTVYTAGQKVLNNSVVYQCNIAGWCSSASALHYEPGTGLNWQDAWSQVSNSMCSDDETPTTKPTSATSAAAAINAGLTSITITWTDTADNENGYTIQRKVNSGSWMAVNELAANISNYTDVNVSASNTYQYRVAPFNSAGTADWVLTSSVTLAAQQSIPASVSIVQASSNANNDQIQISWSDQADNETGFRVERQVNSGAWQLVSTLSANTLQYNDTQIAAGSSYQYRVAPFNEAGTASYVQSTIINIPAVDMTGAEELAFEENCTACHTESGGIGGNLLDSRISTKWAAKSYDELLTKVNTMNTFQCDDDCKALAADYLWLDAWGLEKEIIIVANGRGVRGVRLLSPLEYQKAVLQISGVEIHSDELPSDQFDTEFKYPTQADTGVVLYDNMKKYLSLAEKVSESVNLTSLGCSASSCTSNQLEQLGLKVHRRPLTADEKSDYVSLNNSDGSRAAFASMLMSPHFLYKMELGQWNAGEAAYELDDFELASSLAFMIWGTSPDDGLLSIAASGGLSTDEQVATVVENMMNDSRFAENMATFIKYYTHSYQDAAEKPNLSMDVIESMYKEQEAFVDYWLSQDDASIYKLFNPGYTFVDSNLAQHYNISVSQASLHKVATSRNRGGVLHQGLTQIMNSDFAATSLVKRGKMIRENMMCHTMGVPSGVDPSTIQLPTTPMTTRERWNLITGPDASNGQCWECHQLMNEQGASLEQFDAAGRYRTTEQDYNGTTTQLILDVTGTLLDNSANTLTQFDDARELSEYLGASDIVKDCFADSFVRYATGHERDGYNNEELSGIKAQFDQEDNVRSMIKAISQSSMMRYRVER